MGGKKKDNPLSVKKKKKTIHFLKWAKDLVRNFTKEKIQMAHQYIEKYSNIISAQEMQIKVTITHHYPTHRMATHSLEVLIKKWNNWNSSSTITGCVN